MTKNDRKKFEEWAVGTVTNNASDQAVDYEEGSGLIVSLDTVPRVIYLKSLGYSIDSWEGYAMAEINEMGSTKKVA